MGTVNNSTTETTTESSHASEIEDYEVYRLLCMILNVFITSCSIWITICMIGYGRRKGKWNFRKKQGRMYIACFIPVPLAILRFIADQVRIHETEIRGGMNNCELMTDVGDVLFTPAIFSLYFFLWLKQKAIYAHPIMEPVDRTVVNTLSWGLLALISGSSLAMACAFIIPENHESRPYGCIEKAASKSEGWDSVKVYVLGGFTTIWQIGLLALFIYPMIKNRSKIVRNPSQLRRSSSTFSRQPMTGTDRVLATIRRSVIFATVAVISDSASAFLGVVVIPWYYPSIIKHTLYDLNVFINILCAISTFGKNFKIFLVFCKRKNSLKIGRTHSRTTSSNEEML